MAKFKKGDKAKIIDIHPTMIDSMSVRVAHIGMVVEVNESDSRNPFVLLPSGDLAVIDENALELVSTTSSFNIEVPDGTKITDVIFDEFSKMVTTGCTCETRKVVNFGCCCENGKRELAMERGK